MKPINLLEKNKEFQKKLEKKKENVYNKFTLKTAKKKIGRRDIYEH